MTGLYFRAYLEVCLFKWISKHWDEINADEWVLHSHIIDLAKQHQTIKKSIFPHQSQHVDNRQILSINIDYLWVDGLWYKISFPVRLNKYDAYSYDPREGF